MDPLTRYNDEYKQAQRDRIAELEAENAALKKERATLLEYIDKDTAEIERLHAERDKLREEADEAWAQLGDTQIDLALAQNEMRCMGLRMDELREAAAKFERAEKLFRNRKSSCDKESENDIISEYVNSRDALRALLLAGADNG